MSVAISSSTADRPRDHVTARPERASSAVMTPTVEQFLNLRMVTRQLR